MTDPIEEARALLASHTDAGCIREARHSGDCYVGTKSFDCGDSELWRIYRTAPRLLTTLADECERLRADLARVTAERDDAFADGIPARTWKAMWSGLRKALDDVRAERDARKRTLLDIAMLAHSGGLAGLDEHGTLVAIRRLSIAHWDDSGTLDDAKERVLRAHAGKVRR